MTENGDPRIDVERFGPGPEAIDEVSQTVLDHPSVREQLGEARHRLLSVQLLKSAVQGKLDGPIPPDRYRATIYDYTNNLVVLATGSLDDVRGSLEVSEAGHQPLPNREEFDEAVEVLLEDEDLGPAIREQRLVPYRPMPPSSRRSSRTAAWSGRSPSGSSRGETGRDTRSSALTWSTERRRDSTTGPPRKRRRTTTSAACPTPTRRLPQGASPANSRSTSPRPTGARSGVSS